MAKQKVNTAGSTMSVGEAKKINAERKTSGAGKQGGGASGGSATPKTGKRGGK